MTARRFRSARSRKGPGGREAITIAPASRTGTRTVLLLALALGLLATIPYLHGIGNGFIELDDPEYVTGNEHVLRGLTRDGAAWALSTFHEANWHPLTWLSHMADVSLFGTKPWGHHLASILLHGLNTALLFIALARMTAAPGPSAFVAALFGVHPLHVESVAWVAERKDVLSALFFMLVLLAYERYARRGGPGRLVAVTLLLALGLAAKPMLVTAPFVLLLLDVWPLGRTSLAPPADGGEWEPAPWGRLLLEKSPLLVLSAASSAITFLAQRAGGAVTDYEHMPLGIRVANALVSCATYLVKSVWPSGLAVVYPFPRLWHLSWGILGSALLLAVLSWMAFSRFRRAHFLTVGWLWFLGMLVPVIGVIQVGFQARADRYTYLPLVGVFIGVAWGVPRLFPKGRHRATVLGVCACTVTLLLCAASWVQVGYWKDSRTLFERTLSLTSGNWLIENNLGVLLVREGQREEAKKHFLEALRFRPGYPEAHNNLAYALAQDGRHGEAVGQLREALRLKPEYYDALISLGDLLFGMGEFDVAIVQYREALRLRPDSPIAHNNLATALSKGGNTEESIAHYREALRLRPEFPEAHHNLGILLLGSGASEEAEVHLRESSRLRPDSPDTHYFLGNALLARGMLDEAAIRFREAIRLRPAFHEAHNHLGIVLSEQGKTGEAVDHFREAIRLRPDSFDARMNLGNALAARGDLDEALLHYREAARLRPDLPEVRKAMADVLGQEGHR